MPARTPELNRQYNKQYFKKMTDEERKQFYRDRYQKYKPRYNANSKRWAEENREKTQASVHQNTVRRKYRKQFDSSSITTENLVQWLFQHRGDNCSLCGAENSTHIDHKIPLARGGEHEFCNLRILCKTCNLMKRDQTDEEFLENIKKILDRH